MKLETTDSPKIEYFDSKQTVVVTEETSAADENTKKENEEFEHIIVKDAENENEEVSSQF